ncbi:uncharacterized protein LOC112097350 [Citrus clementina]|uniref:uncharacterized protein LOC112097350 n=1 Tax=Citrus clementina TaxID=85681 RepID=UPI000CED69E7|nr:uncharacterized protein LOC112097350 [Citrus x clementina]
MKRSLKYCEFHEDFGHSTAECFHLRKEIESLILSGYLKEFVADMREARKFSEQDKGKQVANPNPEVEVPQGSKKGVYVQMIAAAKDAECVSYTHDDALVITLKVATGKVAGTLVDTSSSVDIIFKSALDQLLIEPRITPCDTPLVGFTGDMVIPKSIITLFVTIGKVPYRVVHMIDFLIVDNPDAYNIILGRLFLATTKVVIFMHYLATKIPTAGKIIIIKGDQQSARGCYSVASKASYQIATNMFLERYPVSTRPLISLSKRALARRRRVARKKAQRSTNSQHQQEVGRMEVDVGYYRYPKVPVQHQWERSRYLWIPKYRKMKSEEHQLRILLDRLLAAEFIREAVYPDWVSNVFLVKKSNGKWRMCVDFTDLNKSCPKDIFSLPRVDQLVDATAGHEMLSFMDAFSGCNQIPMYEPDQDRTTFITNRGLYCYKVMPFGLKNAGTTHQRLVNKVFKQQIGRTMELYIVNMITKSVYASDHAEHLRDTFNILRKHHMRLNPEKCAFE